MARREFTKAVKVEIVRRATRDSVVYCECCRLPAKLWHIDHTNPDGLQVDKSKPLTAADGQLLCAGSRETCHGRKTAEEDVPRIAKAKRSEATHLRVNELGSLAVPRAVSKARQEARSRDRSGGKAKILPKRQMFERIR